MTDNKVVLITGASSGMGRATAELLSGHGYRVFGTSRELRRACRRLPMSRCSRSTFVMKPQSRLASRPFWVRRVGSTCW